MKEALSYLKNSTFVKNSLVLFLGTASVNILNYLFHLMVGRMVSVEVYGEAESLISLINIISVPAATLTLVATNYAAKCKAAGNSEGVREILRYFNGKVLIYGLPLLFAGIVFTPYLKYFFNLSSGFPLIEVWILIFLSLLGAVNSGILSGWQKFKDVGLVGVYGAIVKLAAAFVLIKIGFALGGIIGSILLGGVISYVASVVVIRFILRRQNNDSPRKSIDAFLGMKSYVAAVFAGSLAISFLGNVDVVLAKHNLSSLAAGQYGALSVVSKIIFFATGVVATVLFSMSAENKHKGISSSRIFKDAFLATLIVSLVATLVYFADPKLVLSLLFGNKYENVGFYLGFFAIAASLFSLANLVLQYALSIHKTKISYVFLVIAALTTIAIFLAGQSIPSMLLIMTVAQLVALLIGGLLLF